MIRWYASLSIFVLSCGSSPQSVKDQNQSITATDTTASKKQLFPVPSGNNRDKNDTNQVLYYARSRDVYDLNAWHIVYSDSMDKAMSLAFSSNNLPKWYNFDNNHLPQYFNSKDGVHTLRKLYLIHADVDTIIPYAMFFSEDTLFTIDTFKMTKMQTVHRGLHFEELLCVFRTKKSIGWIFDYDFIRTDGGQKKVNLAVSKSAVLRQQNKR